jgi:hypothetical protein
VPTYIPNITTPTFNYGTSYNHDPENFNQSHYCYFYYILELSCSQKQISYANKRPEGNAYPATRIKKWTLETNLWAAVRSCEILPDSKGCYVHGATYIMPWSSPSLMNPSQCPQLQQRRLITMSIFGTTVSKKNIGRNQPVRSRWCPKDGHHRS